MLIEEIQEKVIQVANKYDIPRVYPFGSYARNTATEKSDVDLVIASSHIEIIVFYMILNKN
ncbi:nucleotidyltransferase family protein [Lactococcus raffinolactis]|uniref:nucleotidyltransferase family protein n=1 Tax=Pseudolactococcus raffinolactis TaxID=1366 RepID=UPI001C700125|nr:nucleotidyltransferase domain-containing protein [Lactococcus raffinolactis]